MPATSFTMKQIILRKDYITKTVPPRQAVGLYLAKDVVKTWTENFIDEDNQETVSIERNEILYQNNTQVTDKIARDIEEYGISKVNVSNIPNRAEEIKQFLCIAHVKVTLHNAYGKSAVVIVRSDSIRAAMDLAADYAEGAEMELFSSLSGKIHITTVEVIQGVKFIGRTKEDIETEEKALEKDSETPVKEPFKVLASFLDANYYKPGDKSKDGVHIKDKFVVWAYDISTAKDIVAAWIKHEYNTVIEERESLRVVGAAQFIKHTYIPAEYCNLYISDEKLKLNVE